MKISYSLIVAGFSVALTSTAYSADVYRFAGGPSGGGWHPAVSAGTQLINKNIKGKDYRFQYSPSQG